MSKERIRVFDLKAGFQGLRERGELGKAYFAIVFGIVLHWIWEVLVAAVQSGDFDFGEFGIIAARIVIAFIVGIVSFVGIWKQLEKVDPKLRFFIAVTQGFALDSLASPIASGTES